MRRARALWPSRGEAIAAASSAALMTLAFPPLPFVLPVFVCLVPAGIRIARQADGGEPAAAAARVGFWLGVLFYAASVYWIATALRLFTNLAFLGYLATVVGMGVFFGLTGATLFAARRLTRAPMTVLLPVAWVALEMLFNYLSDLAFPWFPLGLAVSHTPLMAQIADLSGVHGVSFWLAATNGLFVDAYLLRAQRRAVVARTFAAVVLAMLVAAYGAWRLETTPVRVLGPVGVVQPNVPQEEKWQEENRERIVGTLSELTRRLVRDSAPELVVWPEVALPGFMIEHPAWRDTLRALTGMASRPIIFGVLDAEFFPGGGYAYYNAAMLADAGGEVGVQPAYRKGYLVPVVERVPFLPPSWFGELKYFGGFGRGDPSVFRLPFAVTGVLICYESIFPQRSRAYRRDGADLILNITNDAWFGRTLAPYQHEAHLRLRAIENRVGIVRSANTGISEYVDPLGRAYGATALFVAATPTYLAETTDVTTLFVRLGDWVGLLSALATIALIAAYFVRRRSAP